MTLKRGDPTPEDEKPEAKELADAFLKNWYREALHTKLFIVAGYKPGIYANKLGMNLVQSMTLDQQI